MICFALYALISMEFIALLQARWGWNETCDRSHPRFIFHNIVSTCLLPYILPAYVVNYMQYVLSSDTSKPA